MIEMLRLLPEKLSLVLVISFQPKVYIVPCASDKDRFFIKVRLTDSFVNSKRFVFIPDFSVRHLKPNSARI